MVELLVPFFEVFLRSCDLLLTLFYLFVQLTNLLQQNRMIGLMLIYDLCDSTFDVMADPETHLFHLVVHLFEFLRYLKLHRLLLVCAVVRQVLKAVIPLILHAFALPCVNILAYAGLADLQEDFAHRHGNIVPLGLAHDLSKRVLHSVAPQMLILIVLVMVTRCRVVTVIR